MPFFAAQAEPMLPVLLDEAVAAMPPSEDPGEILMVAFSSRAL
jgi:hypothetical protein